MSHIYVSEKTSCPVLIKGVNDSKIGHSVFTIESQIDSQLVTITMRRNKDASCDHRCKLWLLQCRMNVMSPSRHINWLSYYDSSILCYLKFGINLANISNKKYRKIRRKHLKNKNSNIF